MKIRASREGLRALNGLKPVFTALPLKKRVTINKATLVYKMVFSTRDGEKAEVYGVKKCMGNNT
jgi:hypothetical protein